jgi:hypothetical protein
MVHVGGTQCAEISCKAIIDYFKERSGEFDLRSADMFMHGAFVSAHRAVLEHLRKGSYEVCLFEFRCFTTGFVKLQARALAVVFFF